MSKVDEASKRASREIFDLNRCQKPRRAEFSIHRVLKRKDRLET